MNKIAVVGTRNGWSSEKLADAVAAATGSRYLVEMEKTRIDLGRGMARAGDVDLLAMDAIIIKKVGSRYSPDLLDRLELLRFINSAGVPVFSKPENLLRVVDRLSCTVTLRNAKIPIPPTTVTEDLDAALEAVKAYGRAVVKPLYTSKARGMLLLEDSPGAREALAGFKKDHTILYIQQKIEIPEHDLGIAFLGGKYLTTYGRRKQTSSWNTTTRAGGTYVRVDPPDSIIELADRAQRLFGLDFTCVDIAIGDAGPLVFEVSAFGGFRGIQEDRGLDPAALYVDYVRRRIGDADS
jgi:ribosomal protein S6--L-glutamate ligase